MTTVSHGRMLVQGTFNFAQLDAEAAYFDLMVYSAKKLNISIGQPARQVTSFIICPLSDQRN